MKPNNMCIFSLSVLQWLMIINEIQATIRVCTWTVVKFMETQSLQWVKVQLLYNPILRELWFLLQNNNYVLCINIFVT